MRGTVVTIALLFTVGLGVLTARDLSRHGVTVPGVMGMLVVALFMIAIVGAFWHPPSE